MAFLTRFLLDAEGRGKLDHTSVSVHLMSRESTRARARETETETERERESARARARVSERECERERERDLMRNERDRAARERWVEAFLHRERGLPLCKSAAFSYKVCGVPL